MNEAMTLIRPLLRGRRATVEPVSQIHLSLQSAGASGTFERARSEILKFAERRSGDALPSDALEGKSFSADDVGTRRTEGIAIDSLRYWTLRFDDDDRTVAGRSWVIETALAEQENDSRVLFGLRLQCIARGENPPYDRSIPGFARDVISACDARLDNRKVTLKPWTVDTEDEVDQLVDLLLSKRRKSDVVVVSLSEYSNDRSDELISSERLARDLAGAAHVVVISGEAAFHLSDRVGREFSVFQQAVRTYRPGFDPNSEAPFAHPLGLADRIRHWNGGPDAYRRFISSEVLRRTVEGSDALKRLPTFAEAKQTAAELRRRNAQQSGSSNDELLALAEEEIEQLKNDLASQKQESGELLEVAEAEREAAEVEVQRLQGTLYHLQQRLQSLEENNGEPADSTIPDDLTKLEQWAATHLAGTVELHNRALRGAKDSEYEDVTLIYQALLLLRDYYVPMRRQGGPEFKQAFDRRCAELGIEEQPSFAGNRAGEEGDTYFIRIGHRRVELDRHLKKGNSREPRYCFRLYFFWDDTTNQVVVGWLPSHLSTRAS
ncbi:hypothetical protein [Paracoccus yeei]|uniref:hypothetical protein n=1 Tax=Paracoccus yeei TaxID=147645 RepID=UPI0011B0A985|nr:hypothetical protein [Paracoccus yeei]